MVVVVVVVMSDEDQDEYDNHPLKGMVRTFVFSLSST